LWIGVYRVIKALASITFSVLVAGGACLGQSGEIHLQFSFSIENGPGDIVGDAFYAIGSAEASDAYDAKDLLHPPSPPGKNVRIYSSDTGVELIKDYRRYDPNLPDLSFPIQLLAYDTNDTGLSGTGRLALMNPSALAAIPADTLVYLRRYDPGGMFLEYYDLRNPGNHSIGWEVAAAKGVLARLELVVIDKCLAADIDDSGRIDLKDFAGIAEDWLTDVAAPKRDVNGDGFAGLEDVAVLAEKWLCDCYAEK
jgi:hypothetical protein